MSGLSEVPSAEHCVVRDMLEKWARLRPDETFVKMPSRQEYSFTDIKNLVVETAAGLHELGVRHGDHVIVWLPNGLDCLRVWFAINWLGAVYIPINTAYKGKLLEHVLDNSGAKVLIGHPDLVPHLSDVDLAELEKVVVLADAAPAIKGLQTFSSDALTGSPDVLEGVLKPVQPWDVQSIIYTSGTTGPSKGVVSSYAHLYAMAGPQGFHMLAEDDRYMCNLPLFHVGGTIPVMGMLSRGGSIALVSAFSTGEFWNVINDTQTTVTLLLGVMATFIAKQAPGSADREHSLKKVIIVPLSENAPMFAQRFGVEVYTLYNMTEISTPLTSGVNPEKTGSCGRPRAGVQVRIVDENDCEVAPGKVGELIVRTDSPWALNSGYFKNPEATAQAWRNGWFHTGDAFRKDEDGEYFFVDRMKDAIRRRGENISSFEVEVEIAACPLVREVAVIPVPSDLGEDEVMCVLAPVEGKEVDPVQLLDFLTSRLPYFMLPRYVRVVPDLPRTPTQKLLKHVLKAEGVTPDTWDRETAGYKVRRERLT